MFREVRERVPAVDEEGIVLSSHCHDDLGLAVANSLAAIEAGARQVECTINGIGERAAMRPWKRLRRRFTCARIAMG